MMSALRHPLVTDYLDRLHAEAARLGGPEARELEASIREHFEEALEPDPSEVRVRETIDRLGDPAELVDAAGGAGVVGRPGEAADDRTGGPDRGRSGNRESLAAVLLIGSAVLFLLWFVAWPMWLAGIVLVALAQRWSPGEKILALASWGTLLPAVTTVIGIAGFALLEVECVGDECTTPDAGGGSPWVFLVALVLYLGFVGWATWRLTRGPRPGRGA